MFILLPVGHDKAIYDRPWFTIGVIVVCTAVQLVSTMMFLAGMTGWMGQLHPNDPAVLLAYFSKNVLSPGLLTYQFAHDGYLHLAVNMMFLWLTGANMEYRWGRWVWAAVYLTGGVVAALTFVAVHPQTDVLLIGASGGIAAAMGAFLVCLYQVRIRFRFFYFLLFWYGSGKFVAPAYMVLPLWFAFELLKSLGESGQGGTAYSTQVGGFVFGAAVALVLRVSGLEAWLREKIGSDEFDDEAALIAQGMSIPPVAEPDRPTGLSTVPPPAALPTARSVYPPPAALPTARSVYPPPALPVADPSKRQHIDSDEQELARALVGARVTEPDTIELSGHSALDVAGAPPPAAAKLVAAAPGGGGAPAPTLGPLASIFRARDRDAMRSTGSMYIEELAQSHGRTPQRVTELVRRVLRHFGRPIPLDDRALAIAVRFAARSKDKDVALAATRALIEQYPRSRYTAGAMLEASEVHRRAGMPDKAIRTLNNLIQAYPKSSAAKRAQERLNSP